MRVWERYIDLVLICGRRREEILKNFCFIVQQMKLGDNGRKQRRGVREEDRT